MAKQTIFTIFDQMDAKGVFESNSANANSRNQDGSMAYKGPVEYPKMLYHPEGKEEVIVPGMAETTPFGPKILGELKAIINVQVNDKRQEQEYLEKGWHKSPALAIAASGKTPPDTGDKYRVEAMKAELARLQNEIAIAEAANVVPIITKTSGEIPKVDEKKQEAPKPSKLSGLA